jgi:hypothetical protein
MNLIRRNPVYPKDRDLSRVVQAAAARLVQKFDGLDPHSLDLSPDARSLICQRRASVREEIERCAHVFAWALPRDDKPFSDLSLVAFADRLGLFALLARECNVGTVVCHNTDGADVDDARVVAKTIGSPADHYVFGDFEDLEFVMKHREISCDVFVSRGALDVMENMNAFFDAVCGPTNGVISLGLGYGKRRPFGIAGSLTDGHEESRVLQCRAELAAAGFQMGVIRSGRSLVLSGSRTASFLTASPFDSVSSDRSLRLEKAVPRA